MPMPSERPRRVSGRSCARARATSTSRAARLRALLRAHDVPRHRAIPADALQSMVTTRIGADANAYTTDDHTAYHLDDREGRPRASARDRERPFPKPLVLRGRVPDRGGRRLRRVPQVAHGTRVRLEESLMATAFDEHILRPHDDGLRARHRDDAEDVRLLARVLRRATTGPRTPCCSSRRRDAERACLPLVEKYYGGWKRGYVAPQIPDEPEQRAERRVDVRLRRPDAAARRRSPTSCPRSTPADRTRVAADLLTDLAFGETSETYRRLVLDGAGRRAHRRRRARTTATRTCSTIYARVKDPAKVDYVLGVIDETVEGFRARRRPTRRGSRRSSNGSSYGFLMGLQTPESVARGSRSTSR